MFRKPTQSPEQIQKSIVQSPATFPDLFPRRFAQFLVLPNLLQRRLPSFILQFRSLRPPIQSWQLTRRFQFPLLQ